VQMHTRTNQVQYLWFPEENHLANLHWHLPLIDMDEAAGRNNRFWKEWIQHPSYDDYWQKAMRPVEEHYADVQVPVYGMGGWFDVFLQGTLNNFMGVRKHGREPGKSSQKVVIGPWIHSLGSAGRDTVTGDVDFGPAVRIDLMNEHVRWFDYWLKGVDNGIADEPPVNVFVMGANRWRRASDWPIPGTRFTQYYLHSGGSANSSFGDGVLDIKAPGSEDADHFVYDPRNPVLTVGGSTCCSEDITPVSMGPRNQQYLEWRPDVLVYSTPALEDDVEVMGPVSMVLYASSDARDTDFTAKLVDVYPDGRAYNVAQGIIRARYRDSWEEPTLLEPGRIYKYTIDLWSTSNRFLKGHRIRVEVSSSNFPQFDRNPNTGNPFGMDAEMKTASQTVYHDAGHPSHIVLPVVPVD
jgi:putative CocE/NonD family hydrolase